MIRIVVHHSDQSSVKKAIVKLAEVVASGTMHFVNQTIRFLTDGRAPSLQVAMP